MTTNGLGATLKAKQNSATPTQARSSVQARFEYAYGKSFFHVHSPVNNIFEGYVPSFGSKVVQNNSNIENNPSKTIGATNAAAAGRTNWAAKYGR